MKYLFAILISLMSIAPMSASSFNPSQYRSYGNDCLDEYKNPSTTLACGVLALDSRMLHIQLPRSIRLEENPLLIGQGNLGCCTAFAIIAALEILEPGKTFSESELYIRVKTKGRSYRNSEGCFLKEYQDLLLEGVVV